MIRFAHYLKPCLSSAAPKTMLFFDCESFTSKETETEKEQALRLYTAVYYRKTPPFHKDLEIWDHGFTTEDLASFVTSHIRKKSCLYVFSANIWFDLRVSKLFQYLTAYKWEVKSWFSKGKAFQLVMTKNQKTIRFLNIQNILDVSVARLGQIIGLEKLSVDFATVSDAELLTYCYRDTEIIYRAIMHWFDFLRSNDLGAFGITLPSQAMNAYRYRFMDTKIAIHDKTPVLALERAAYFGGRCECWFIGTIKNKKIYDVDINSMYPYVMKYFKMPYKLIGFRKALSIDEAKQNLEKYALVANCDIITDEPLYPVKHNGKTIFPIGAFNTSLCTGSLMLALKKGHIKKINFTARYLSNFIFSAWVTELYRLRMVYQRAKNTVYIELTKKLLNALYGKFGQKSDEVIEDIQTTNIDYYSERVYNNVIGKWVTLTHLGNRRTVKIPSVNEGYNSFPAIAAHVTDYARLHLWKLIEKAGRDNVYYMDTDSLFVNHAGYKNLKAKIHKTRLGALKLEKSATYLKINGPKDYVLGAHTRIKGIPAKAQKLRDNFYAYELFPGIRGELKIGMKENYAIRKVTKVLARTYDKGTVTPTGKVIPFLLS